MTYPHWFMKIFVARSETRIENMDINERTLLMGV